jgi:DNA-directed RNA polymerase subunit RPC12/RpoP
MSEAKPKRAIAYPCPACGASQVFDPADGQLTCRYCGHKDPIPETTDGIQEYPYDEYLRAPGRLTKLSEHARDYACSSCGAVITFTGDELSDACAFCGTSVVVQPKESDPLVSPVGIVPFRIPQVQATQCINEWLKHRWFAPNALKRFAGEETISGVYLPFWTYDADTTSHYTGERGEHYWETETYTDTDTNGNTVQRTRQVEKTRWYTASGTVGRQFDNVLVPATTSVHEKHLTKLGPWDLGVLRAYDTAYLAGFKSQRYQVELPDGFAEAKGFMASVIHGDVTDDIGGDEQRVFSVNTSYFNVTFKYILLPVYIGAYRFNDRPYQVLVNALSGQVHGDRPYSAWKITFLVLVILAVAALVYIYVQSQQ